MATTLEDKFSWQTCICACLPESNSDRSEMARCGTLGREHPPFLTRPATVPEKTECSVAHRYISNPGEGLAVRNENQPTIPIDVFDSDLIKLLFVPHPGIAHENHDIAAKFERPRSPIAPRGPRQEFSLRFTVQPQRAFRFW